MDKETGIECHKYGSHIFHTNNPEVMRYLERYDGSLNNYRHRVLSRHDGRIYQMPVNLSTIEALYGSSLTPQAAENLLRRDVERFDFASSNLEERALAQVGPRIYNALIKEYTWKQWGTDPKLLPAHTISRLPVRFSYKSDYFDDPWQGIPRDGYAAVLKKILAHPRIDVQLGVDYFAIRGRIPQDCLVVYTGPIDQYFNYQYGLLGWRTLRFEKEIIPLADYQGASVINYPDRDVPYTRIHEFRHYHPERVYIKDKTVIYKEYSCACGPGESPYYPINALADQQRLDLYLKASTIQERAIFGGRLGRYQYLDMDKTIAAALKAFKEELVPRWEVMHL